MIRRRTITSYVWNSVSGNKMVILSNCIRNFFRKFELIGNSVQGENPAPDNPQEIKSAGRFDEASGKYLLDVKVTGKNLLDKSIILPLSSYDIKDGIYWRKYFYLLPNTDYLIRVTPHYTEKLVDTSGFLGVGEPYDNNLPNGIISLIPDVGTTDKTNYFRTDATGKVILKFKDSANEENIRKMLEQVEITLALKTFNNEHEPYTEQSMQIVLNEPLRGVGEYKDVLTKDGVVRKIKRTVFDGSEDEKWGLSREHENHINFALVIKGAITVNTGIRTMMDKFKYFGAIWNSDLLGQDMFGATLRINMPKTLATDLQTFKTWLSQNPLTVDYVLAEPATEPLPESVQAQAQLQALHSENGTTHVFVDSGEVECGINIEYKYKS